MAGPLIVAAELAGPEQQWLERLRRTHFPADRLKVGAHLTMFHALPPSVEAEVRAMLAETVKASSPSARIEAPYSLGGGVAFRILSSELESIREELADHFHGMLTAQDQARFHAHVTVQNKVEPTVAAALLADLRAEFKPIATRVVALGLYRYEGGPWSALGRFAFRG